MIDSNVVKTIVEEWLQKGEYFLVDVCITPDNRIIVEIDHADGVWIEDCAELSRLIQERIGDEIGEYELEVGSAGIGQPFKVAKQYENHIGKEIEVLTDEAQKNARHTPLGRRQQLCGDGKGETKGGRQKTPRDSRR